jgi:hypothetical protein
MWNREAATTLVSAGNSLTEGTVTNDETCVYHGKHKRHYFVHTKEIHRQQFIDKVTATILSGSPHRLESLITMQI